MRYAFAVLLAGTFASGSALAQGPAAPPSPANPGAATQQPAAAAPASDADSRRDEVRAMEVFLLQGLRAGALELQKQLRVMDPTSAFVTGTGRARGFVLDGYGVFFDVDVPEMRQSVVWSAQIRDLEQQRQWLVEILRTTPPEDPRRRIAEANIRTIDKFMGGPTGTVLVPNPTANTEIAPGRVSAAVAPVAESAIASAPAPPAAEAADAGAARARAPEAPPVPGVQALQQRDPNELYTNSVKNALIDVMLRHGHLLKVGDNEWLTVAASDSAGPQPPGQLDDTSRILISIRGSDLAAFRAGKLTREEVWKKVAVREF